jgi:hypothetical protein
MAKSSPCSCKRLVMEGDGQLAVELFCVVVESLAYWKSSERCSIADAHSGFGSQESSHQYTRFLFHCHTRQIVGSLLVHPVFHKRNTQLLLTKLSAA